MEGSNSEDTGFAIHNWFRLSCILRVVQCWSLRLPMQWIHRNGLSDSSSTCARWCRLHLQLLRNYFSLWWEFSRFQNIFLSWIEMKNWSCWNVHEPTIEKNPIRWGQAKHVDDIQMFNLDFYLFKDVFFLFLRIKTFIFLRCLPLWI